MESAFEAFSHYVELGLNVIAVLLVAVGALHGVLDILKTFTGATPRSTDKRDIYIHFAQWLVAALTFQLAADIVATTSAPHWDEIGRVAAIAAIRTFLTYFLDRDLESAREMGQQSRAKLP